MNKVFASADTAVSDIPDGATIAIGGFGPVHCWPRDLITAVRRHGCKELTTVSTSVGDPGTVNTQTLIENGQVKKMMASFTSRVGVKTASEDLILAGKAEGEVVPQGMLAERCRAGGAGIPAFYSPTGASTALAAGKEVRYFNGRRYVLEQAICVDFALLRAWRADKAGNVQFRGSTHNFNVSFAKSAKVAIVEVDEIVEVGEIPPDRVGLPGIFVARVVLGRFPVEKPKSGQRASRREAESARSYNGKPGITRDHIARRAAALLKEGSYVNLGTGIPVNVCNYLEGRDVMLHAENGVLGYGGAAIGDGIDPDVYIVGSQHVTLNPGASFFDSVTSFEMARGGHLDAVVLGAYQVDEQANLANWSTSSPVIPGLGGIGGAMDLVAAGPEVIIVMEHLDSKGRAKLLRDCTLPLTAPHCVTWVVTDLALLRWNGSRFVLEEVASGFTVDEVIALTEMRLEVAAEVRTLS